MIKNSRLVEKLEQDFILKYRLTYKQSLAIFESMWNEAVRLGALPSKDPLDGIDSDIRIASILNSCLKKSS